MSTEKSASSQTHPFRVTRLPGPTAREVEEQAAEYIEATVAQYDGRNLGARTRRDGSDGLRVDFTYDATTPPVAMEITALVVPDIRALGAELVKLEAELRKIVRTEELGTWLLGVRVGADLRTLKPPLIELLRGQRGRSGVALFSPKEASDDLPDADRQRLTELFDLGLISAMRIGDGNELSVFPPISDVTAAGDDLGTLLKAAMEANVDKLREARPRETHLVVSLDRSDLSADPLYTPAPRLLDGIDVLWVLLGYYNAKWTYRLWRTTVGELAPS